MTDTNPEIGSGIPPHAAEVEPPAAAVHAGGSADIHMGVTGNAVLLLGFISGVIRLPSRERLYDVEGADPANGTLIVRRVGTDNTYRVSIVQLEGREWA